METPKDSERKARLAARVQAAPVLLSAEFNGERFDGGTAPLESLRGLAVLETMVLEIARWQYKTVNPDRRFPKKFLADARLCLTAVRVGSCVAEIKLLPRTAPDLFAEVDTAVEAAVAALFGALDTAARDEDVGGLLPKKTLARFDELGGSLGEGEWIAFTQGVGERKHRFDPAIRRKFALAAAPGTPLRERVRPFGEITQIDIPTRSFVLRLPDGTSVKAVLNDRVHDSVKDAMRKPRPFCRTWVRVVGTGIVKPDGTLKSIEKVKSVDELDPLDLAIQFAVLRALKRGWFEKNTEPLSREGLERAAEFFRDLGPMSPCYLYPMAEDGVKAEWPLGDREASLEILFSEPTAYFHCFDKQTDRTFERDADLSRNEDVDFIRQTLAVTLAEKK